MSSFHCPFCNIDMPITSATHKIYTPSFESSSGSYFDSNGNRRPYESAICVEFFNCPKCNMYSIFAKASATLARRCLQGMIRDFHGITKSRLVDEINALQSLVPASQWKAIGALRSIGNIVAHMEKDINTIVDVDSGEAEKLLKLIELLIDKWYIARHDEEELFSSIETIGNAKASTKKSNQSSASSNVS